MPSYYIEEIKRIANSLKIDIDIYFEDIPICNKTEISRASGIYILKNNNGERYIGVSGDIYFRQLNHHIYNTVTIDVYLVEDINVAIQLEKYLIYHLQPELNIYGKGDFSEAQKKYQEKNPVIRIDRETYDKLMEHSNKTRVPIKNIIKEMTSKYLNSEEGVLDKIKKLLK